ncbi:VOC family protein [Ornithinimicrobium sp. Y1847]|uniref:VOC family protein n=1 Tax=unclassified Ornithinimicrobium TaxID=2615080 RepID=UPI003B67BEA1
MSQTQLFACLRYRDADAALTFLGALGFEERLVIRDEADPRVIHHAQLRWRETGGVMLGSVREDDLDADRGFTVHAGTATTNLVVASDDEVDQVLERAVAAGASVVQEPSSPPHGGRAAMVRDAEGNLWNIDSYAGE